MKLTKKYLEKLIKEECSAMLPLDGEEEVGVDVEDQPGAVDLPDDPDEAFGIGYTAGLEAVLEAIQGLMPNQGPEGGMMLGPMPGEEEVEVDVEEEFAENLGRTMHPKRNDSRKRKK